MLTRALVVAAELDLAGALAAGPRTADELAAAVGADPDALRRLLRMLASHGIFSRESDRFALDDVADCLRDDAEPSLRELVLYYGAEPQRAWGELLHSIRTGKPGFDRAFGTRVWEHFERDPDAARVFNGAMRGGAHSRARILRSYPFPDGATVVDVGGGSGELAIDLVSRRPDLHAIVVDRPHVVREAQARIDAAGLAGRCRAVPGDLFSELPAGGDAYVLAIVLHDWNDADALRILETCRRAAGAAARLLVIEAILDDEAPDDVMKLIDLHMLVETGGRERTEPEWRSLLDRAGFRLERILPGVPWCLLEAVPA